MSTAFTLESVLADARAVDNLDDPGPGAFEDALGTLLESYSAAPLNELGSHILRSGAVRSLAMRLRATEWFRRHPEIAEERINAPIVVVGMMRTGTTLMQRLLAADSRSYCAYGWEVGEVAPPLDIDWAGSEPRIAAARAREEQSRAFVPDLFAIHPMYAEQAEEEIMFLADAFLSHVPEASAHVPAYRTWLDTQDFSPAYDHLHRMLQLLQWQKRQRGLTAERWVLKTPAHLGYLDTLVARFPDAHVVHMHRDPVDTIPSGASLNATLWRMHADEVDPSLVGAEWIERMGFTNDRALATRDGWGDNGRCTDIQFEDAAADPIAAVRRVYDAIGLTLPADAETAMRLWHDDRPRETAARPSYTAADFGLSDGQIRDRFGPYVERFRPI